MNIVRGIVKVANMLDGLKNLYGVLKVHFLLFGLVAQLVRAPPCHGGGRGFESHPGRFIILGNVKLIDTVSDEGKVPSGSFSFYITWNLSSAGRASALQAEGHRFEPCRFHYLSAF